MKILVTGSAGGIGQAVCEKFLKEGHEVTGMDIKESVISHPVYTHVVHDIRNEDYPEVSAVEILVNSAGIQSQTVDDINVNLLTMEMI